MDNFKALKIFYCIGSIVFLGIGISNLISNNFFWENMILSAKVSAVLGNIFNFVLSALFFNLFIESNKKAKSELKEKDIEEAIKNYE